MTQRYVRYQPDSNCWPLQAITNAAYLALAILVTWVGWLRLRARR